MQHLAEGFQPPPIYTLEVKLAALGKSREIAEAEAKGRLERERQEHLRRLQRASSRPVVGKARSVAELPSNDMNRRIGDRWMVGENNGLWIFDGVGWVDLQTSSQSESSLQLGSLSTAGSERPLLAR
jgi:hypothetical protein